MIKDFVVVDILDERAKSYEQGERGNIRNGGTKKVLASAYNALACPSSYSLAVQAINTAIEQTNIRWAFSGQEIESWHYSSTEEGDRRQHYLGHDTPFVVILYSRTPSRTGMKIVRRTNG